MKNLKQIVCTILTAGIIVTSLPVYSAAATVGDLNDDGVIDKADVGLFAQYFAGWLMTEDAKAKMLAAGDVNGDEAVTRADAMELARNVDGWDDEVPYICNDIEDLKNFNENNEIPEIHYDEHGKIHIIDGVISNVTVENSDDAIRALQSVKKYP